VVRAATAAGQAMPRQPPERETGVTACIDGGLCRMAPKGKAATCVILRKPEGAVYVDRYHETESRRP